MDKNYQYSESEREIQSQWERDKIYSHENNPGPLYSIDTPPPTISGTIHIGNIFSYTHADIIARYKRMSGYSVFYPFGFDNNGLPTERYVEKTYNTSARKVGRSEFIKLCMQKITESEKEFRDIWQRIGLSVDWNYSYSTISDEVRRISQASFIKLYNEGHIYRQHEPALYCTTCQTTVAQAELDDRELDSVFNDIVFRDENGNQLIVSTTRPELLYSTVALLCNPDDTRYQHLKNKKAYVPIYNTQIPVYEDKLVDIQRGSGLVMVSTFGDQKDILWYKNHRLPLRLSIGLDGKLIPETGIVAGLKVNEARRKVMDELRRHNLLAKQTPIKHAVNVHERCKKEIEYTVIMQWFVRILEHKKTFIELADKIAWHPAFMKSRYINWVENIKWDWCISRQRFFGIPFPVWHCNQCKRVLLADIKQLPIDPQETSYPDKKCSSCGSNNISPDTDIMDTWNTSALTPYICYHLFDKKSDPFGNNALSFIPMAMRPHAHDIIRTWSFYTIVKTWMHHKTVPWKELMISGHALSNEKEKISKSKENNPLAPENILKRYPADALRYWTASGGLGHDISFSETQVKVGQRLVTKLWNAFRFTQQHLIDFKPEPLIPNEVGVVNAWILDALSATYKTYQEHLNEHEFCPALNAIEEFFWANFCDNYLEFIKDQLFHPESYDAQTVQTTKWTLHHCGLRILQMYAPYVPYITELLYQQLYRDQIKLSSIHQTRFSTYQHEYTFEAQRYVMKNIITVATQVRKLKTGQQLSLKAPLATLFIHASKEIASALKDHAQLIKGISQASHIEFVEKDIDTPIIDSKDNQWFVHTCIKTTA